MALEQRLQQRIRASKFIDNDLEEDFSDANDRPEDEKGDPEDDLVSGRPENAFPDIEDDSEHSSLASENDELTTNASHFADISFGALASAQASLGKSLKRKRSGKDPIQSSKRKSRSPSPFHEAEERQAGKKVAVPTQRSSKHAPAELSSKKAVSRKRAVVTMPTKPQARDPRFSSLSGNLSEDKVKSNYAFLNDYRASEVGSLRNQIKQSKDAGRKEALRLQLRAMEDRERARQKVEEERRVLREHRKQERDAVQQGKQPFFLKQSEVKKQVLQQKFEGMSEKKAEKMMERRRKKRAQKERKHMPDSRRVDL